MKLRRHYWRTPPLGLGNVDVAGNVEASSELGDIGGQMEGLEDGQAGVPDGPGAQAAAEASDWLE